MAPEDTEDLAKLAKMAPPVIEAVLAPAMLHRLSNRHRTAVTLSHTCGCFYCCDTFNPQQVKEWTDAGCTALCPLCGIDAVLPSHWVRLTPALLKHMHAFYFETYTNIGEDTGDGDTGDLG